MQVIIPPPSNGLIRNTSTGVVSTFDGTFTSALVLSTGIVTISGNSATVFNVGPNGATNPVLTVDASTASQAAGLKVTGATSAGNVALAVISSGSNANLRLDGKGSGTVGINVTGTGAITLGRATTITTGDLSVSSGNLNMTAGNIAMTNGNITITTGNVTLSAGTMNIVGANASAFRVGRTSGGDAAFLVDASAGSGNDAAGLQVSSAAAFGTVALVVLSSFSPGHLSLDAKGAGNVTINTHANSGTVTIGSSTGTTTTTVYGFQADAFTVKANVADTILSFSVNPTAGNGFPITTGLRISPSAGSPTANVAVDVVSSNTNSGVLMRMKGAGTLQMGQASGPAIVIATTGFFVPGLSGGTQSDAALWANSGAPSNANGANGDYYLRSDGGAVTHLYFKSAGVWAGIV